MADITPVIILDNDTLQDLWVGSDIMHVSVTETSKATRYAVEDGTSRNDHVIQNPTEISISMVLAGEVARLFQLLKQTYLERKLVTVQTKTDVYTNMLVEEIPHEQDAGMTDGVTVDVRLVEWREVKPEYGELTAAKVAQPRQSDTVKRGSQATSEAPPEKRKSVLRSIF